MDYSLQVKEFMSKCGGCHRAIPRILLPAVRVPYENLKNTIPVRVTLRPSYVAVVQAPEQV
jgi:hypothetical protein